MVDYIKASRGLEHEKVLGIAGFLVSLQKQSEHNLSKKLELASLAFNKLRVLD